MDLYTKGVCNTWDRVGTQFWEGMLPAEKAEEWVV